MSWTPLSGDALQYVQDNVAASGYYIKLYASGTTTPISIATDSTGGTTMAKAEVNSQGRAINGSDAVFIPHIDQKYKFVLYPNATDADNNTFANAVYNIDAIDQFAVTLTTAENVKNFATLAAAVADTSLVAGDALNIAERTTGNGGGAMWKVVLSSTVTENTYNIVQCTGVGTLSLVLREDGTSIASRWGATGDGSTDDSAAVQAAIDDATAGPSGGSLVELVSGKNYIFATGIEIPANVTLDCKGALTTFTASSGYAFTLGDSDDVLSYRPRLINHNIKLQEKLSNGVRLRGTVSAEVCGQMEGHTGVFDNTRTNIGVDVDGVNISSFFNDIHDIYCNHMHEGLRVWSTGTSFPTAQYIKNFNVNGDQATDTTSVGINWAPSGPGVIGEGSVIMGGYIEKCNVGVLVGAASGMVSVHGLRFEMNTTGSSPKFSFLSGTEPWTLFGIKGLGLSYLGSNDGITGFGTANHTIVGDENGSLRLAGMSKVLDNKQFVAIGGTAPGIWTEADADFSILQDSDQTGTGRIYCQTGKGSGAHGAGWTAHAAAHASNPGELHLYPSTNAGEVKITDGLGGTNKFEVDTQNNHVKIFSIPTSSSGLPSGTLWSNSGVINIIP